MAVRIELDEEKETRLRQEAGHHGMDLSEYVQALIEGRLPTVPGNVREHFYHTASPEEWESAFDAIEAGHELLPLPSPNAFERESLYEDRF